MILWLYKMETTLELYEVNIFLRPLLKIFSMYIELFLINLIYRLYISWSIPIFKLLVMYCYVRHLTTFTSSIMNKDSLNEPLPSKFGPNIKTEDAVNYVKNFLKEVLPHTDRDQVDKEENWRFPLEKYKQEKKHKQKYHKKKLLTRNEKKNLGLLKLPKDGWDYSKIAPMNKIWLEYMHENLEVVKKAPHYTDADYNSFCAILNKSELIGAEITVVRSNVPTYVGMRGIIVYETKYTFQIVTSDSAFKILIKESCVFVIYLRNMKFTIYGKALLTRPSDRSIKKIKSYIFPDL